MYSNKRHVRTWASFPAIVLIVAISVIAGPAANAAYTTQVPFGAAGPFAVLAAAAVTANAGTVINGNLATLTVGAFDVLEPAVILSVGATARLVPVAVVPIPRLPATSTNDEYEQLKPVNFVQGFALGFALVLIGGLLLLGLRRSV